MSAESRSEDAPDPQADRQAIIELVSRVARAQDNLDAIAYRACFTDMVWLEAAVMIIDWKPGEISADELTRRTMAGLSKASCIQHLVTNHIVELDGDEATCAADLLAIAISQDDDKFATSLIGGRYALRLRRTEQGWRICQREVKQRYRISNPQMIVDMVADEQR